MFSAVLCNFSTPVTVVETAWKPGESVTESSHISDSKGSQGMAVFLNL